MQLQLLFTALLAATSQARPQNAFGDNVALTRGGVTQARPRSQFRVRTDRPVQKRANQLIPVIVGGPQDTFVPNMVLASVGDVIQFQFSSGNHTVTQSAENAACTPLQATVATAVHSGHIPFVSGQTTVGTFNMPVTSTDTMYMYCATGPHCIEGQVMVINPSNTQQLVNYAKLSAAATANVDGLTVVGGTVGSIPLAQAAFVVSTTGGGGGGGGGPGAGAGAAGGAAAASGTAASGTPATTDAATAAERR